MKHKKVKIILDISSKSIIVFFGFFIALLIGEITLWFMYPLGVFKEGKWYSASQNWGQVLENAIFIEKMKNLWEDIEYRESWEYVFNAKEGTGKIDNIEDYFLDIPSGEYNGIIKKSQVLPVYTDNNNIAIIWDSIAEGHHGDVNQKRFSWLLNEMFWDDTYVYNFAIWGHNISQIGIQYQKYVAHAPFNTVIYIYYNNDLYFSKIIGGREYYTPTLVLDNQYTEKPVFNLTWFDSIDVQLSQLYILKYSMSTYLWYVREKQKNTTRWKILDYWSNKTQYLSVLSERFLKTVLHMNKQAKEKEQRFIVLMTPARNVQKENNDLTYDEIYKTDMEIYKLLIENGIEVINMYEKWVQNSHDFFWDNCCHLNEKWHQFYAQYLYETVLNK